MTSSKDDKLDHIQLFSLDGKLIFQQKTNGEKEEMLDISNLEPGIYILKTRKSDATKQLYKIPVGCEE